MLYVYLYIYIYITYASQFSVALDASGCNPATTAGLWVMGKMSTYELIYSIISQCLGAIIALPLLQYVMGSTYLDVYDIGPSIPIDVDVLVAFASEMMIGVYMLVYLAASSYIEGSSHRGISILKTAVESYTYVLIGAASCSYSGTSYMYCMVVLIANLYRYVYILLCDTYI